MKRDDFLSRYPDRLTEDEKRAIAFITDPEVAEDLRALREQGKYELFIHGLEVVNDALDHGMSVERFNKEIHKPGVYLGEPGKIEELVARCM